MKSEDIGAIPPVPDAPPVPRLEGQIYREPDGKSFAASLKNLTKVMTDAHAMGVLRIAYDTFLGKPLIGTGPGHWAPPGSLELGPSSWRLLTDPDEIELRTFFEERGFKPVPENIMSDALTAVSFRNRFDSARDYCDSLRHDGIPRIDVAMTRYFGCAPTPYSQALGAYLFTALAGRAIEPGCQVDMVPVLVGLQGTRKTTAVAALAPFEDAFGEVSLEKTDEQLAYLLRGKLVVELAEMRGVNGRDAEATKAWITRRVEEWREPYNRFTTRYARRAVIVGTANRPALLDDETGERRWLPIMAGVADVDALIRDRDQLWAEGVSRFYANGIEWQAAESLARSEHSKFKIADPWHELVAAWLDSPPGTAFGEIPSPTPRGDSFFTSAEVLSGACGIGPDRQTKAHSMRLGKLIRSLGYESGPVTIAGRSVHRWRKLAK